MNLQIKCNFQQNSIKTKHEIMFPMFSWTDFHERSKHNLIIYWGVYLSVTNPKVNHCQELIAALANKIQDNPIKTTAPVGSPHAEIGIKMSSMLLLASYRIMLLDNFNQEIRKFKNFFSYIWIWLCKHRMVQGEKENFLGLTFVMRIKSCSFLSFSLPNILRYGIKYW